MNSSNRQSRIDPLIHAPHRLSLCAFLSPLEEAEFQVIRRELGVSESVFSKHVSQLVDAGYLRVRQGATNGRARKWASLTPEGRGALKGHLNALKEIVAMAESEAKE